jgi:hypothetical protein
MFNTIVLLCFCTFISKFIWRNKMIKKYALFLLMLSFFTFAQQEQAGIDIAASFPSITQGTIEHDLPADGNYWDPNDPGWGVTVEIQKRPSVPGGYFLFMTAFFYDENNEPFWCAVSSEYNPQVDANKWRDAQVFSNIPWASTQQQVLVDIDVDCHSKTGGTALGSSVHKENHTSKITKLHLVWRTPSRLEITPEGGQTHYTQRLALHDNLVTPSADWLLDAKWLITSSVRVYGRAYDQVEGHYTGFESDYSVRTGFERLDVSEQPDVRAFVGHKDNFVYYISKLKASTRELSYSNFGDALQETPFAPYINGGHSNTSWIVLVHDSDTNTISLYTVAGDKAAGLLRPDAGIEMKFRADVNPDADVIDFYPLVPICLLIPPRVACQDAYHTNSPTSMATWSPQNVHTSTMKMFKLKTGGNDYLYTPNNGESNMRATERITQMLVDAGILDGGD